MSVSGFFNSMSQMLWGTPAPKKEVEANSTDKSDGNGPVLTNLEKDLYEKKFPALPAKKKDKGQLSTQSAKDVVNEKTYVQALQDDWVKIEDLNRTDDV